MAEIKVRELDDQVVEMLKAGALSRGISLEDEVRTILTDAIAGDREALRHEAEAIAERIRRRNPGPPSDSVQIVRDERDAWGYPLAIRPGSRHLRGRALVRAGAWKLRCSGPPRRAACMAGAAPVAHRVRRRPLSEGRTR